MIEISMVRDLVAIFGVLAGFTYYVLTVRNSQKMQKMQLETRQAQLFMQCARVGGHIMAKGKRGFAIWETDDPVKIAYKIGFMLPEVKYTLIPGIEAGRAPLILFCESTQILVHSPISKTLNMELI
jgi:hypothetical protein